VALGALPPAPGKFPDWTSFLLATEGSSQNFDTLGQALYDLVITGPIRETLDRIEDSHRLLLRIDPKAEELATIPWEFMRNDGMPLFTDVNRPVARAVAAFDPALRLAPVHWPLRVMLVVGSKDEQVRISEEIGHVRDAFRRVCGLVDLEVAWLPNREYIRTMCAAMRPHVFHFVGHGAVDDDLGGHLRLEQPNGPVVQWTAPDIRGDLDDCGIRLAVLNACQSGQEGEHRGARAAAAGLAALKVPAVIAMQGPITGKAAALFAKGLYQSLSAGVPLDRAVAKARLEVTDVAPVNERDYAMPSLVLRAPPELILGLGDPWVTLSGQPRLAGMLSFVDRIAMRQQLWKRLKPDQVTGSRVLTVTGPARTGKGSLVRWCLGVALVRGYPVAFADLSKDRYVDSAGFLDRLIAAVSAGCADEIRDELAGCRAELDAYRSERSKVNSQAQSLLGLYERLGKVLAAAERTLIIGIDGLTSLDSGAWLDEAVPAFVQPIALGQRGNVRLIFAVSDSDRPGRFPPRHFVDCEIENISLRVFPSASFVELASQRLRAQNYTYAGFSGLVNGYLRESVNTLGYWDTQHFDILDIHATAEMWPKEDEDRVISRA
jgi:hypothetical protein